MSFPAATFDEMIRALGELVVLRDRVLHRSEIAGLAAATSAIDGLQAAVSAVGRVAETGDPSEVAAAYAALAHARGLFAPVALLVAEAEGPKTSPSSPPEPVAESNRRCPGTATESA
jgi:hypothetical protein